MLNRREFLAAAAVAAQTPQQRPNVLFLMSDEHSPHALGAFGNRLVRTPAIDSIAAEGVGFRSAYCQNPVCVPSRASFVTGRMPSNVGVYGNNGGLDAGAPTMAQAFKKAGYEAVWFGKEHWGGDPGFDNPFREWGRQELKARGSQRDELSRLPEEARVAAWPVAAEEDTITKEQAVRYLKANRGSRPFFAGVSFKKPHFPFVVQESYLQMYRGKADLPRVTQRLLDELPAVSKAERKTYGFAKLTDAQIRFAREVYFGMVTYIDDQVGDILRTLDDLKLRGNTIVLYTADHGELAGEHGLWYKNSFYQASAGIPFVWSYPKALPKRRTVDAPVMNMDIFPTLCDLCGLPPPAGLEGRSLLPLIAGKESGQERYALAESYRGGAAGRMIRMGEWKFCHYDGDVEQLFHLRDDPDEVENLVARPEQRERVSDLRRRALAGWKKPERPRGRKKKESE